MMTGAFTHNPDLQLPMVELRLALESRAGADASHFIDAYAHAQALLGDTIFANMFLLGYACQLGHLPVGSTALIEAIRLNGVEVERNIAAFNWGRRAAHDPGEMARLLTPVVTPLPDQRLSASLDEVIDRRAAFLEAYQSRAYANRYRARVDAVRRLEAERVPGETGLADAVARSLFKLMAYKDEYEVARLFSDGAFARQVEKQFTGDYRLEFHLAPPMLASLDPATGRPRKRRFGPWMMGAFKVLARLKALRGTPLDPFGYSQERKLERQLIRDYEALLDEIAQRLGPATHATAVELAALPQAVRGFGPVKQQALATIEARRAKLLDRLRLGEGERRAAA
jgi:indolepyruvate ferredoxin oxidoreductase